MSCCLWRLPRLIPIIILRLRPICYFLFLIWYYSNCFLIWWNWLLDSKRCSCSFWILEQIVFDHPFKSTHLWWVSFMCQSFKFDLFLLFKYYNKYISNFNVYSICNLNLAFVDWSFVFSIWVFKFYINCFKLFTFTKDLVKDNIWEYLSCIWTNHQIHMGIFCINFHWWKTKCWNYFVWNIDYSWNSNFKFHIFDIILIYWWLQVKFIDH